MARRFRPRKQFLFWLYHDIAEQVRLMEYIAYLQKTRQFATVARNGLRLMWTLSEGDLSVLFELFPTLQTQFKPDNSDLIAEFRQLLKEQQPIMVMAPSATPALSAGLKPMTGFKPVEMPTFDDDDQGTVIIRRDDHAAGKGAAAFMDSVLSLQTPTAQ